VTRRRQQRVEYDCRDDIEPLRAAIEQQGGRLIDSSWEFQHSHPGWSVRYPDDRAKADAIENRMNGWEAEGRVARVAVEWWRAPARSPGRDELPLA
jgi:hypothetical protein